MGVNTLHPKSDMVVPHGGAYHGAGPGKCYERHTCKRPPVMQPPHRLDQRRSEQEHHH